LVRYVCDDVLNTSLEKESFRLIHDSGTLDSIAMTVPDRGARGTLGGLHGQRSDSQDETGLESSGAIGYFRNIAALLEPGGFLLLKTCNHSLDEIQQLASSSSCGLAMSKDLSEDFDSGLKVVIMKKVNAQRISCG